MTEKSWLDEFNDLTLLEIINRHDSRNDEESKHQIFKDWLLLAATKMNYTSSSASVKSSVDVSSVDVSTCVDVVLNKKLYQKLSTQVKISTLFFTGRFLKDITDLPTHTDFSKAEKSRSLYDALRNRKTKIIQILQSRYLNLTQPFPDIIPPQSSEAECSSSSLVPPQSSEAECSSSSLVPPQSSEAECSSSSLVPPQSSEAECSSSSLVPPQSSEAECSSSSLVPSSSVHIPCTDDSSSESSVLDTFRRISTELKNFNSLNESLPVPTLNVKSQIFSALYLETWRKRLRRMVETTTDVRNLIYDIWKIPWNYGVYCIVNMSCSMAPSMMTKLKEGHEVNEDDFPHLFKIMNAVSAVFPLLHFQHFFEHGGEMCNRRHNNENFINHEDLYKSITIIIAAGANIIVQVDHGDIHLKSGQIIIVYSDHLLSICPDENVDRSNVDRSSSCNCIALVIVGTTRDDENTGIPLGIPNPKGKQCYLTSAFQYFRNIYKFTKFNTTISPSISPDERPFAETVNKIIVNDNYLDINDMNECLLRFTFTKRSKSPKNFFQLFDVDEEQAVDEAIVQILTKFKHIFQDDVIRRDPIFQRPLDKSLEANVMSIVQYELTCPTCRSEWKNFENVIINYVVFHEGLAVSTVQDAINLSVAEEDVEVQCNNCQTSRCKKKPVIYYGSNYLSVALTNRYLVPSKRQPLAINRFVKLQSVTQGVMWFEVNFICVHDYKLSHFISFCRRGDTWFKLNDLTGISVQHQIVEHDNMEFIIFENDKDNRMTSCDSFLFGFNRSGNVYTPSTLPADVQGDTPSTFANADATLPFANADATLPADVQGDMPSTFANADAQQSYSIRATTQGTDKLFRSFGLPKSSPLPKSTPNYGLQESSSSNELPRTTIRPEQSLPTKKRKQSLPANIFPHKSLKLRQLRPNP